MSDKPSITVQRRRKGSKPTGQAERPTRPQPARPTAKPSTPSSSTGYSGSSSDYSSGSSGSFSSSGGNLGSLGSLLGMFRSSGTQGNRSRMGCGCIGIIIVGIILFFVLKSCSGLDLSSLVGEIPYKEEPAAISEPAINSAPSVPGETIEELLGVPAVPEAKPTNTSRPSAQTGDKNKWLVMVYQDADDQALEQDIFIDMNEMERIGSVEGQVMIVSQIDRFRGGFASADDFSTARRYLITYDDDLNRIGSDLLMDLGEVDMADGDSLVDFATWAIDTYPSEHYVLIMSDHGMGWPGGWSDPSPTSPDPSSAPIARQLQTDSIYLNELDEALAQIQANTGIEKFDLIGMDACLMSQMEVYMMLQPYAHTAVASEETEPGLGWAYSAFLSLLVYDPSIDATQLAANIVETYIDQDERVTDDQARADFLNQNSSTGGFFGTTRISAAQLASQLEQNITLTAVNLDNIIQVNTALNDFAYAMQSVSQQAVASARSYTQSYTSIFGRQVPPSYIDLGHFAALVYKKTGDATIKSTAQELLTALNNAIIAERHGDNKPGSTGVAIYFPNSSLYQNAVTGMQSYTTVAGRFAQVSLWDDFLAYHYSNRSFTQNSAEAVVPSPGLTTRAPGGGNISLSQITASDQIITTDETVDLSVDITGDNIGYIYLFTAVHYPEYNSILVIDTDYLESPNTEKLEGLYYPVWPDSDSFTMNFNWEPYLFEISDGNISVPALFNPLSYGATAEQAIYAVDGTYTFSENGEQRKAQLLFMDEKLFQVYGYLGDDTAGAPSEITPNIGDSFTISYKWMDLDTSGNVIGISYSDGETLTFSETAFTWETAYAFEGEYLLGFLVSDLDGNTTPAYKKITVQ